MSNFETSGKLEKFLPVESGTSKAGKEWKKQSFIVKTEDEYNNTYCFEVFGDEKVEQFVKFNRVGQNVDVDFNVKTNEWKGKYFTSLSAWKIFKAEVEETAPEVAQNEEDDLPF